MKYILLFEFTFSLFFATKPFMYIFSKYVVYPKNSLVWWTYVQRQHRTKNYLVIVCLMVVRSIMQSWEITADCRGSSLLHGKMKKRCVSIGAGQCYVIQALLCLLFLYERLLFHNYLCHSLILLRSFQLKMYFRKLIHLTLLTNIFLLCQFL